MGYYSHYKLEVNGPTKELEKFKEFISCKDEYDKGYHEVYNAYFPEHRDTMKWYEYQDDLKRLSKDFPKLLFSLLRKGEEAGDVEKSYYKNGKAQICPAKLSFEKYSPRKLEA